MTSTVSLDQPNHEHRLAIKIYTARPGAWEWTLLAAIVILAAVLRLGWPGVVEFKRDEANLSVLTLDLVHGRNFPLLGIDSSVGIRNAPMNVYALVPPYLLSSNPIVATEYVGLLNVIAVLLVYGLARRYYGVYAAVVAGLLYAVSPWAVIYSRKIWAQDMLPLFVLLTIGAGLLGFIEGKRWAQLVHLPLLAITGQIHYVAFVLIPISLYLIYAGRRRLTRKFFWSFGLVVLLMLPYLIGLAQSSSLGTSTLATLLAPGDKAHPIVFTVEAFQLSAMTIAGIGIEQLAGPQAPQYLASLPTLYPLADLLLIAMLAGVLLATFWLIVRLVQRRDARSPIDIVLLLWLLVTPFVFSFTWTPVFQHYMIPMIPAAFLILGVALGDLLTSLSTNVTIRRGVLSLGAILLLGVGGSEFWMKAVLLNFVDIHNTGEGFATPLHDFIPIRDAVLSQHPQNVLASLDGQYIGFHDQTTVWNALLYDVPSVRFLDDSTEVYPAQEAVYLSHNCTAGSQNFTLRPGEDCYAVSSRGPGDLDLSLFTKTNPTQLTFANGARITAYRWAPEQACLWVVWGITAVNSHNDLQFAVHFTNDAQQEIVFADSLGWRAIYWRVGDTVVKRFCISNGQDRVGEITGVKLGMYRVQDTPQGQQFLGEGLLDSKGTPASSGWVEVSFASS